VVRGDPLTLALPPDDDTRACLTGLDPNDRRLIADPRRQRRCKGPRKAIGPTRDDEPHRLCLPQSEPPEHQQRRITVDAITDEIEEADTQQGDGSR